MSHGFPVVSAQVIVPKYCVWDMVLNTGTHYIVSTLNLPPDYVQRQFPGLTTPKPCPTGVSYGRGFGDINWLSGDVLSFGGTPRWVCDTEAREVLDAIFLSEQNV
jgi:hypothetical protein